MAITAQELREESSMPRRLLSVNPPASIRNTSILHPGAYAARLAILYPLSSIFNVLPSIRSSESDV